MKGQVINPNLEQVVEALKACATTNTPDCPRCYLYQMGLVSDGKMSTGEWCNQYLALEAAIMHTERALKIEGLPHD